MSLPKDPYILLSVINMKLRDCYSSFDELCEDINESAEEIVKTLKEAGFEYDKAANSFK